MFIHVYILVDTVYCVLSWMGRTLPAGACMTPWVSLISAYFSVDALFPFPISLCLFFKSRLSVLVCCISTQRYNDGTHRLTKWFYALRAIRKNRYLP